MLIFNILLIGWTLIPFLAIGLVFLVLLKAKKKKYKRMPWAAFNGLVFSAVFTLAITIYIFTGDSNLSPLIMPIYGTVAAFVGLVAGWSFSNIILFAQALIQGNRNHIRNTRTVIRVLLSIVLLVTIVHGSMVLAHTEFQQNKAASSFTNINDLRQIFVDAMAKNDIEILKSLAKNQSCPRDILEKLSRHESRIIRQEVASNEGISLEILNKLSNDQSEYVRYRVACNDCATADILRKLSNDNFNMTKLRVACHPNTPIDVLQKLMKDDYWSVRKNTALNPNVSEEILSVLSQDPDENVRRAAIRR